MSGDILIVCSTFIVYIMCTKRSDSIIVAVHDWVRKRAHQHTPNTHTQLSWEYAIWSVTSVHFLTYSLRWQVCSGDECHCNYVSKQFSNNMTASIHFATTSQRTQHHLPISLFHSFARLLWTGLRSKDLLLSTDNYTYFSYPIVFSDIACNRW